MITALDHFVLVAPDINASTSVMSALMGQAPVWQQPAKASGYHAAEYRVGNTALELMCPADEANLDATGAGLKSLVFATEDIEAAHHTLTRRGLNPSEITAHEANDTQSGTRRAWRRFRLDKAKTYGVRIFLIQRGEPPFVADASPADVSSLDHIVINTPNPERAVALYGGRLGLRLALDRTAEQWSTRFLFFRVGGLTFEVIHRLDQTEDPDGPDHIWGVTWTVDDIHAAQARLSGQGLDVSEVRKGRKPGTQIFTLRDGNLDVPTLFIAHTKR